MKKLFLVSVVWLTSLSVFAQDYPFAIQKSGAGAQAIVFIPGFACSGDVWKETVNKLAVDYTCYVLTMAGFAGIPPEENPSFEHWEEQIARFIQVEKIGKPILVGHSMGGGLALAIASNFPNLIKKAVIVDALPCLMALTNPGFQSSPNKDCSDMVTRITAMSDEQFARMQRMSVASLTTDSFRFDEIVNWGLTSDRETFASIFCEFSNTDLREQIKHITISTLVLLEPHFHNIEPVIKEQYRNLSGVQLKYADKGLHFIMFDDREWFMNQLNAFITEQ